MKDIKDKLKRRYQKTRQASLEMCKPLNPEQCRIQPSIEVSPPWWNLAHTSWFFNRNVIEPFGGKSTKEDALFDYVLNSYYEALGPRLERHKRGLITRPTMKEVFEYRRSVDERIIDLMDRIDDTQLSKCLPILEIGLQHEQQHQELFYSEVKFILYQNPPALRQEYAKRKTAPDFKKMPLSNAFIPIKEGLYEFGNLEGRWGWDNEYPIHKYFLKDFQLQNRLVTNGEYLEFMEDGGYSKRLLWLDNGWYKMEEQKWNAPLYWELVDGNWELWTLSGMQKLDLHEPVCHVSFYEAEAFATWKKARLPSEREWEVTARMHHISPSTGNFLDTGAMHPLKQNTDKELNQMMGDVWEWTSSYFEPYPGYTPFEGVLAEYNEKFMDNQRVLRGGSCVSERDHIRVSYRNFWPPETRFQFSGIRLAKN
jgi:ergothioneine biosynthesis protein EgtB